MGLLGTLVLVVVLTLVLYKHCLSKNCNAKVSMYYSLAFQLNWPIILKIFRLGVFKTHSRNQDEPNCISKLFPEWIKKHLVSSKYLKNVVTSQKVFFFDDDTLWGVTKMYLTYLAELYELVNCMYFYYAPGQ